MRIAVLNFIIISTCAVFCECFQNLIIVALQVPWPVESSHHHVDRTMASYDNKNFINLEMPTRGVNQISDNGHFFQFLVLLGNFFSSCCFVLFCFVLFCFVSCFFTV